MSDIIKKHEALILGVLGLVYMLVVMAWPAADFSKAQFVETGAIIIGIVVVSSNFKDGLSAFARSFDWKQEALNFASLLRKNGIQLNENRIKLLAELLGLLDQHFEAEEVTETPETPGGLAL